MILCASRNSDPSPGQSALTHILGYMANKDIACMVSKAIVINYSKQLALSFSLSSDMLKKHKAS